MFELCVYMYSFRKNVLKTLNLNVLNIHFFKLMMQGTPCLNVLWMNEVKHVLDSHADISSTCQKENVLKIVSKHSMSFLVLLGFLHNFKV